jgi:hypothetical protein
LTLQNTSNNTEVGTPATITVTIHDNDTALSQMNPIDSSSAFVIQHYIDFLNREPELEGLTAWKRILDNCVPGDKSCDRVEVSSGFYRSSEFQDRGNFIYNFYRTALGRPPHYNEFVKDMSRTSGFQSSTELEANKALFAEDFIARDEFQSRYGQLSAAADYISALQNTAGVVLPNKDALVAALQNNQMSRGQVLRAITESSEVRKKYYNESFVVMQYFGYLRRDPDIFYLDWIKTMDQTGDYRTMINGFMNSTEYRQRFGQ